MMKKFSKIACCLLLISILCSVNYFATSVTYAISVSLQAQQGANHCWAACVKSCLEYYGITGYTQANINNYANPGDGTLYSSGATPTMIKNTLYYFGLSSLIPDSYPGDDNNQPEYLHYSTVINELNNGRPIIANGSHNGYDDTHSVLVMGYYTAPSGRQYVGFKNPAPAVSYGVIADRNTVYTGYDMLATDDTFVFDTVGGDTLYCESYLYHIMEISN